MARWVFGWGHSLTKVMEKSWNLQNRQNMSWNFTNHVAFKFEQRDGNRKLRKVHGQVTETFFIEYSHISVLNNIDIKSCNRSSF